MVHKHNQEYLNQRQKKELIIFMYTVQIDVPISPYVRHNKSHAPTLTRLTLERSRQQRFPPTVYGKIYILEISEDGL